MKNKEDLKKCVIQCKNLKEKFKVAGMLNKLGFYVEGLDNKEEVMIFYNCDKEKNVFLVDNYEGQRGNKPFLNFKQFIDISKKFLLNNQLKKEQLPDFEVDDEGRVLKINHTMEDSWENLRGIEFWTLDGNPCSYGATCKRSILDKIKIGSLFISQGARDKALFKLEIEQQLRTITHRLNNGEKIDWGYTGQKKFNLRFNYIGIIKLAVGCNHACQHQGLIYCLSENFLSEALKEIGEERFNEIF